MPWTRFDYPDSMKNLPAEVRNKAIEIANALLDEKDMEEGIAIATAISRAKDWAANRGKRTANRRGSKTTDVKEHGEDRYVVPHDGQWAVKAEGRKKPEKITRSKKEAISRARSEAKKAKASLTIQRKTGTVEKRISYNPNRSAPRQTAKKRAKAK